MPLTLVPPRKGRSRNYTMRGNVLGRNINKTTGVADAERADKIRIKYENQILDEAVFGKRASRKFSEAAVSYLAQQKPGRSQVEAIVGHPRRDGMLSRNLVGIFGDHLCDRIDQGAVDRAAREHFADVSPATLQRALLTPLIAVLTWASKRQWCGKPQFDRPKLPKKGRARAATYDEADRLLACSAPHVYRIALFLMLTGARMSEALELDWADVDLNARWAVLRDTKNALDRGIPLHPQVVAMLANLPHREGIVLLSDAGLPYAEREGGGHIKTGWAGACRRAGIVGLRPHDLRHTASTWLTLAGAHEQVRDEILGHAVTTMGRHYSHIPQAHLLAAIDRLPARAQWARRELARSERR